MSEKIRDYETIQLIVVYCNKIEKLVQKCSNNYELFEIDWEAQDAISMNILQIGERIHNNLSKEFKESFKEIPWLGFSDNRDVFAHSYFRLQPEILWNTAISDIPNLKEFCIDWLIKKGYDIPKTVVLDIEDNTYLKKALEVGITKHKISKIFNVPSETIEQISNNTLESKEHPQK